jgi:hypothetical protein
MSEKTPGKLSSAERKGLRAGLPLLLGVIILVAAVLIGVNFVRNNVKQSNSNTNTPASSTQSSFQNTNTPIDSLITYKLPPGWTDTDCISGTEAILFISPTQPRPNCAIDLQKWSMRITMDPQSPSNCSQIKVNNQQITNHVCASQFINGKSAIKSSTTYNEKSSYAHPTKVEDYFISTGKGTIKLEYIDDLSNSNDDFQAQFDQLASSVKTK